MLDIREKAKKILAAVPETGEIRSDRDQQLFQRLTGGVTHKELMENWKSGGIRTVCIEFVGWYAGQMGIDIISSIPHNLRNPKTDGFFNLQETLTKCGKGYAYVAATHSALRPKCGDILRHKAFHVDVALGFDGDILLRVAGGQSNHPRPAKDVSKEYDNIRLVRGRQAYDFKNLIGWLDIEKFLGVSKPSSEPPGRDKTGLLWINGDGDVVHPSAPSGGGGPGFFRTDKPLCEIEYNDFLPHPLSPMVRVLDPLRVQIEREKWRTKKKEEPFG